MAYKPLQLIQHAQYIFIQADFTSLFYCYSSNIWVGINFAPKCVFLETLFLKRPRHTSPLSGWITIHPPVTCLSQKKCGWTFWSHGGWSVWGLRKLIVPKRPICLNSPVLSHLQHCVAWQDKRDDVIYHRNMCKSPIKVLALKKWWMDVLGSAF